MSPAFNRIKTNSYLSIALHLDALFEVEVKVRQHLEANGFDEKGPLWPMWLLGLCNRYGNMRLQDFLDPAVPSRQNFSSLPSEYRSEWLEGVARGRFESFAVVGHEIIKETERRQEKKRWESDHSVRPFANELNEIEPSLTWGEILFHYISVLTESRDREALKELDRFFPAERYCIECSQVFEVDKYNPRRFRCKKCSGRLRVRRYRAKQEPR